MNFNEELQNLIKKAESKGYEFIDGKFKNTKIGMIPVMEVFFISNSTYEDSGRYNIYKKTVEISEEDFKKVLKYAKSNNYRNVITEDGIDDYFYENIIGDIFYKYDESKVEFDYINNGEILVEYNNRYRIYSDNDECVDLWFSKDDDDNDLPRGYVSFYKMTMEDFKKSDDVDLNLEKFMRYN